MRSNFHRSRSKRMLMQLRSQSGGKEKETENLATDVQEKDTNRTIAVLKRRLAGSVKREDTLPKPAVPTGGKERQADQVDQASGCCSPSSHRKRRGNVGKACGCRQPMLRTRGLISGWRKIPNLHKRRLVNQRSSSKRLKEHQTMSQRISQVM
ncbi:hypothetical protein LDENG_00133180 [Lucifuga dentata]|nr:hypothetical protein LDENG_00133180 [Lucifuga dentata]